MKQDFKKPWNKILHKFGVEVNFEQMKLADGITVLEAESFEPGYSVGIVTPEGIVPAPIGEHETAEGQIIVVEVEGQIKEVKTKETEEETTVEEVAEPAEQMNATPKKTVETVSKETFFAEMGASLKVEFEAQLQELKSEIETLKVELSEAGAKAINHNPEPAKVKEFSEMTGLEKHRYYKQLNK